MKPQGGWQAVTGEPLEPLLPLLPPLLVSTHAKPFAHVEQLLQATQPPAWQIVTMSWSLGMQKGFPSTVLVHWQDP